MLMRLCNKSIDVSQGKSHADTPFAGKSCTGYRFGAGGPRDRVAARPRRGNAGHSLQSAVKPGRRKQSQPFNARGRQAVATRRYCKNAQRCRRCSAPSIRRRADRQSSVNSAGVSGGGSLTELDEEQRRLDAGASTFADRCFVAAEAAKRPHRRRADHQHSPPASGSSRWRVPDLFSNQGCIEEFPRELGKRARSQGRDG